MMKIVYGEGIPFFYKRKLNKVYSSALKILGQPARFLECEIDLASIDEIKELNKKNRGVDKATDVLSFPYLNIEAGKQIILDNYKFDINPKTKRLNIGNIIICQPVVAAQAMEFGHSELREFCYLATHGLLHLLGFDHIEKDDEELMTMICEKIMIKNNILRVNK